MSPTIAAAICVNLLHYFPTGSPLQVAVANETVLTCNQTSSLMPIRLRFNTRADVQWWQTHTADRQVIDEDDNG